MAAADDEKVSRLAVGAVSREADLHGQSKRAPCSDTARYGGGRFMDEAYHSAGGSIGISGCPSGKIVSSPSGNGGT